MMKISTIPVFSARMQKESWKVAVTCDIRNFVLLNPYKLRQSTNRVLSSFTTNFQQFKLDSVNYIESKPAYRVHILKRF